MEYMENERPTTCLVLDSFRIGKSIFGARKRGGPRDREWRERGDGGKKQEKGNKKEDTSGKMKKMEN